MRKLAQHLPAPSSSGFIFLYSRAWVELLYKVSTQFTLRLALACCRAVPTKMELGPYLVILEHVYRSRNLP
jgi:hypothetical protein